jgi:hypothetical protein
MQVLITIENYIYKFRNAISLGCRRCSGVEGNPLKRMVKKMPECEICGEESDKLIKCKSCGAKFCEDCGSPIEKLCEFCAEEEEVTEEDLEDVDEGSGVEAGDDDK